jgi:hypothetical protein
MAKEFRALFCLIPWTQLCMFRLVFVLGQPMYNCLAAENNNSMKLSRRISMIHERLRAINKPTIKSIQVQYNILLCMSQKKSDGDIEMAE